MSSGFSYSPDLEQGFNFKADEQSQVMHVLEFEIGSTKLDVNLGKIINPETAAADVKVVGIGSSFSWDGKATGPIAMSFNVDVANMRKIMELTKKKMDKTLVTFKLNIYDFDSGSAQKAWYKCFHTNDAAFKGSINKASGDYAIYVSEEADPTVQLPVNYRVTIVLDPDEKKQQDWQTAFAVDKKLTFGWGIEQS
jgi:hypothetical protein